MHTNPRRRDRSLRRLPSFSDSAARVDVQDDAYGTAVRLRVDIPGLGTDWRRMTFDEIEALRDMLTNVLDTADGL